MTQPRRIDVSDKRIAPREGQGYDRDDQMTTKTKTNETLATASAHAAKQAAYRIHNILREHTGDLVPLRDPEDDELTVPRHAAELLRQILSAMAAGTPISVIPGHAELTTQQAADLLNVSRPYLIGLLERDEIEYRMVGTHRRVLADSLDNYQQEMRAMQIAAADKLTAVSQEMDLY